MKFQKRWVWGLVLLAVVWGLAGFRRVPRSVMAPPKTVLSLPFGSPPTGVGRDVGVNGRSHGPLAFALLKGGFVVADSYHSRLLWVNGNHIDREVAVPGSLINDVVCGGPPATCYVSDAKAAAVYQVEPTLHTVWPSQRQKGWTTAIWDLGITAGGHLLVQQLGFGQGGFRSSLQVLDGAGKAQLLSQTTEESASGPLETAVQDFTVAPSGALYVQVPSLSPNTRRVRIYGNNWHWVRTLTLTSPEAIATSNLLGVDQQGDLYWGINLLGANPLVLTVNAAGKTTGELALPAPGTVTGVAGRVAPDGTLYLVQNTNDAYRIVRYQPRTYRVWQWRPRL